MLVLTQFKAYTIYITTVRYPKILILLQSCNGVTGTNIVIHKLLQFKLGLP
jgi:hypothetical protein